MATRWLAKFLQSPGGGGQGRREEGQGGAKRWGLLEGEERGILDASEFPLQLYLSRFGNCAHSWGGSGATSADILLLFSALEKWQRFTHRGQPWTRLQLMERSREGEWEEQTARSPGQGEHCLAMKPSQQPHPRSRLGVPGMCSRRPCTYPTTLYHYPSLITWLFSWPGGSWMVRTIAGPT